MEELEEDFDLIGKVAAPTDDDDVDDEKEEETSKDEAEEEETVKDEEETSDESEPDEEETEEEKPKPQDNRTKALIAERAKRKEAERKLKELEAQLNAEKLAQTQEEQIAKEREAYKQKMLDGDIVDEEVADKLLDVFGDDIIKNKIANQKREEDEDFDMKFSELKKDELYMDADVYKPRIKELVSKGLTIEEAYGAAVGSGRLSQLKKDLEIEVEQKLLNNNNKADATDVGHAEVKGEVKRGKYTKREQEIARETGVSLEEVHKRYMRPGELFSIDDLENL